VSFKIFSRLLRRLFAVVKSGLDVLVVRNDLADTTVELVVGRQRDFPYLGQCKTRVNLANDMRLRSE
jgi:hypothetical protein